MSRVQSCRFLMSILTGRCAPSQDRGRGAKLMGVQVTNLETSEMLIAFIWLDPFGQLTGNLGSKGRHPKMLVLRGIHENPDVSKWFKLGFLGFLQITLNSENSFKSDLLTGRSCSESHGSSCWCVGLKNTSTGHRIRPEKNWREHLKERSSFSNLRDFSISVLPEGRL